MLTWEMVMRLHRRKAARLIKLAPGLLLLGLVACSGATDGLPPLDDVDGGGPPAENTFDRCQDGEDNDQDGKTDCSDDQCAIFIPCGGGATADAGIDAPADGQPADTSPAVDMTATTDMSPSIDTAPAVDTAPPVDTAVVDTSTVDTGPSVDTAPAADTIPTVDTTPPVDSAPALDTTPAVDTCQLGQSGDPCTVDADCCSNNCVGGRSGKHCAS